MIKKGTLVSYKFTNHEIIYGIISDYLFPDLIYKVRVNSLHVYGDLIHCDYYLSEKDLTIIGE